MHEYSNDIQIGYRWADAPEFRFEGLSESRASIAAHAVTATFDIVVADRLLTRELPAQPMLTFLWNLSLCVNALRREAASDLDVYVEGSDATLRLSRRGPDLQLSVGSAAHNSAAATMALEEFAGLLLRRTRELKPTLERLPRGSTRALFFERVRVCELLLSRNVPPASMAELAAANMCFSTSSTTQDGERIVTTMAVDPAEVRQRPPERWFGELSVTSEKSPQTTVASRLLTELQTMMGAAPLSLHPAPTVRFDAEQDARQEANLARLFSSTDDRRNLLEHVAALARDLANDPGGPSAAALRRLARDAHDRAVSLLSSVDISFEERRREIAQIVSEPDVPAESAATPRHESRPFAARNLRRLRLEREWAMNLDVAGDLEHIGADSHHLLLAFRRSLTRVDLRDATAATMLRAAPGSTLRYETSDAAVCVNNGSSSWSFHVVNARLVSWPEMLSRATKRWWRHLEDGTLVAYDPSENRVYRKRLLAPLQSSGTLRAGTPMTADRDSCLLRSTDGRIQLVTFPETAANGDVEWTAAADFGTASRIALDEGFVVLIASSGRGQRVVWLDRHTGLPTWSAELPEGRAHIHSTDLGPVISAESNDNSLHTIRLDAHSGTPGLLGRFDLADETVLDIRAEGEHLFVRTESSILCTGLTGRLHEPRWARKHQQTIPSDQVQWAISGDVIAILGDHLTLVAAETGHTMFEVPAFWEELVFASIDADLHLVVVERRAGREITVHRLHCRGFLAPVG